MKNVFNPPWTPLECFILENAYRHEEDIDTIQAKLPDRTLTAIKDKACQLHLTKKKINMATTAQPKTIERLEAELKFKKAQAELEAARQRYTLFAEQFRIAAARQLRMTNYQNLSQIFRDNAKEFSRLNGGISNASRKLLEAQIELDLL